MLIYGKMAANAIAVSSYLAAHPEEQIGSARIAEARGISRALTAKILNKLALAGYVSGRPGPGGGYRLARPAETITLAQIIGLFEHLDVPVLCPFGVQWRGAEDPCPLHDSIAALIERHRQFMETTDLSVFVPGKKKRPSSPKRRSPSLHCSAALASPEETSGS